MRNRLLAITKAAGITFNGTISATTIDVGTIPVGGGSSPNTVRFAGNLNVDTLNASSGNYGIEIVGSSNIINTATFNNTYFVVVGDNTTDTALFSNGLTIPSAVTTGAYLIGTIRSSGAPINISRSYFTGNTTFDSTNNGASSAALVSLINTNAAGHNLSIIGNASLSDTLNNIDNFSVSGTTDLDLVTSSITTTRTQSYGGAITLNDNMTLAGSSISLGSILDGSGFSLTLTGNAIFNDTISGLSSLSVSGTSSINTSSISTTGQQTYSGAITLLSNTALSSTTGSPFSFGSAINGARALTVSTSGNTTFSAAIGSTTPLANLTINAGVTGEVKFDANATVTGNIAATARNIKINANVVSNSGDISLIGDAGTPVSGAFHGVHINGSGVEVKTLATNLIGGATGSINIQGRGGAISSGTGGNRTHGVYLQGGAAVSAGGMGIVSVTGIGGASTVSNNSTGVLLSNTNSLFAISEIRTAGGSITVTGTGGGTSGANENHGVSVRNFSRIAAGGGGNVSVTGTTTGGTGNAGVIVNNLDAGPQANPTAAITSAGGDITITGSGTATEAAVVLRNAGRVASGGSGNVTVVADSLVLDTNSSATAGSITAGSGGTATATIRPRAAGTLIDLGGADVLNGSPLTLGLSPAEIARITAGTLVVGSSTAGSVSVSQSLTMAPGMNLSLLSGSGLNIAAALSTTSGGNFSTTLGAAMTQTAPLNIAGRSTIATGSADALLTNSANAFAGAFSFSGRSLQLASSGPLNFAASSVNGDLIVTTANAAITQSGPLRRLWKTQPTCAKMGL